ncbi:MAG: hypothetical protein NTY03_01365, partial [Candidatus Bathyarchaeota archaeon]|nr:hypothetical protein [Candidatus Bathyarchaeota archaeon]
MKIIWKQQRKAASTRFTAFILIIMALVFGILLYTLSMVFFSQYQLEVTGGNNPTGQGWYNGGTNLTLTSDWVWGEVAGQSRSALTNWQLDGVDQNP